MSEKKTTILYDLEKQEMLLDCLKQLMKNHEICLYKSKPHLFLLETIKQINAEISEKFKCIAERLEEMKLYE